MEKELDKNIAMLWRDIEQNLNLLSKKKINTKYTLKLGATETEIKNFEKKLDISLPNDYRSSLQIHNGFSLPQELNLQNGLSIKESVKSWQKLNEIYLDADEWDKHFVPISSDPRLITVLNSNDGQIIDVDPDDSPEEAFCERDASYIEYLKLIQQDIISLLEK